jgi:hypothetical protein
VLKARPRKHVDTSEIFRLRQQGLSFPKIAREMGPGCVENKRRSAEGVLTTASFRKIIAIEDLQVSAVILGRRNHMNEKPACKAE